MQKLTLLIFTILLTVNFTGIPVMLHYCEMTRSVSLSGCEMCDVPEETDAPSCCMDEPSPVSEKISGDESCCTSIFAAKPAAIDSELQKNCPECRAEKQLPAVRETEGSAVVAQSPIITIANHSLPPPGIKSGIPVFHASLLI